MTIPIHLTRCTRAGIMICMVTFNKKKEETTKLLKGKKTYS